MSKLRISLVAALATTSLLCGCSIHVNKDGNGEDKDVSISTPFGGMHVNSGTPVDTGMPVYPGAVADKQHNHGDDKGSADVRMGFGPWEMRVQAASYVTPDPLPKVQAFYTKALAQYGTVLVCRGHHPEGAVTVTTQGLTCDDHGKNHTGDADLTLKAGSEQRQHVVGFDTDKGPGTHFALVSLVLPRGDHEGGNVE